MNEVATIISQLVSIISSGATLLLAFLCLINIQGVNKPGNRWLGVFMLCIFFLYVDDILRIAGINIENETGVAIVLNFSAFVFAPVFYYAVSYFITPDRPWKIKDYFHLLALALVYVLLSAYILYKNPSQGKQGTDFITELVSGNFGILYCLHIFYYCASSWVKLKKHEQNVRLFTSTIENVDLTWLKYVVISVLMLASFFIISISNYFSSFYFVLESFYLIGFFAIACFAIKQKEIYPFTKDQKDEIIHTVIQEDSKKQESKKLIDENKLEDLRATILKIMENDKPFLDCELTLVKLASMTGISLHQLSYLINTGFNENFYQFVNRYRIEESKKMIVDDKMSHLSFQGIAQEVGFKSKSVFYVTFKKVTGQTPSEYKQQSTRGT